MRNLFLALVVVFSHVGCTNTSETKKEKPAPEIPKVEVMTLTPQTWHQTIRTFGVIEAAEKVIISAEFSGKVNDVFFHDGLEISAGQELVAFDVSERRMHFKQAEGNLSMAKANLKDARRRTKRREELYLQKVISKEQLEMVRSELTSIEAQYEQLLVGRSLARHQLKRTKLVSPVAGKVVSKSIEIGEVAMPGQPLALIHVTDTMRVVTYVTEQEINTVQVGAECVVTTPGVRGREYKAHIESLGNEADRATGNFSVKLTVENKDGLLKTGMTAVVTLKGLEVKDALLIPEGAVVDRNRKRVVFLVNGDKALEVEPVLGAATGELLPVLHGLESGDKVVVSGLDNVVGGTALDISHTAQAQKAAPAGDGSDKNTDKPLSPVPADKKANR